MVETRRRRRLRGAALAALACATVAGGLLELARRRDAAALGALDDARFAALAEQAMLRLRERLADGALILESSRALFAASELVSADEFARHCAAMRPRERLPGFLVLVFLAREVDGRTARGIPTFPLWTLSAGSKQVAVNPAGEHFPVTYRCPDAGSMHGYDLASDEQAPFLAEARRRESATLDRPVTMGVPGDWRRAFAFTLAIPDPPARPGRSEPPYGFVRLIVENSAFFGALREPGPDGEADVEAWLEDGSAEGVVIFDSGSAAAGPARFSGRRLERRFSGLGAAIRLLFTERPGFAVAAREHLSRRARIDWLLAALAGLAAGIAVARRRG